MLFFRQFGFLEVVFIIAFVLLYLMYISHQAQIATRLKITYRRVFIKMIVRLIYIALILVSILAPSFGDQKKEIKIMSKDIFVVLDISPSMQSNDIQPTRLERTKFELQRVIDTLNSDRIGLIPFSRDAFVQCPLTYDKNALKIFLKSTYPEMLEHKGSDISNAIELAVQKHFESKSKNNKVIILFTDGNDLGSSSTAIFKRIIKENLNFIIIGVGNETNSFIKVNNKEIKTDVNRDFLEKMAASANGIYLELSNSKNDLNYLIKYLDNLESKISDTKTIDVNSNKYHYFLFAGLLLMLLDSILTARILEF